MSKHPLTNSIIENSCPIADKLFMRTEHALKILNDHKCVWKRRIDSTDDKSIKLSVWKPSCSENSYIDNSGQFCRDCAGIIQIAEE